jgi:hypothetical protein
MRTFLRKFLQVDLTNERVCNEPGRVLSAVASSVRFASLWRFLEDPRVVLQPCLFQRLL